MTSKTKSALLEISARLATIGGAKTVIRGVRKFEADELPAYAVYRQTSVTQNAVTGRTRAQLSIVIEGHRVIGDDQQAADIGEDIIEAIRAAIETDDATLGGLLRSDLLLAGDTVSYPEDAADTVSGQVIYSAAMVHHWGNPAG